MENENALSIRLLSQPVAVYSVRVVYKPAKILEMLQKDIIC